MSSRRRARASSTSIAMQTPPFIVTASGCAPPMPPSPAVSVDRPAQSAAEVLARRLGEGLVGALQDALGADVDPRAGRHLAVHRQALALEVAEDVPGRPRADEVASWRSARAAPPRGCGRRRPACRTGPAASRRRRGVRSSRTIASNASQLPRRPPGAAVDDEVVRALGDLGVEVVHQHAQGRFLLPAAAG